MNYAARMSLLHTLLRTARLGDQIAPMYSALIATIAAIIGNPTTAYGQTCLQELAPAFYDRNVGFGQSVSLGDFIAAVGEPTVGQFGHDSNGSASVYGRNANTGALLFEQELIPDERQPDDYFGKQVAVGSDFVAVYSVGNHLTGSGVIYVFERSAGQWAEVAQLSSGENVPWYLFGSTLMVSEDMILVSAPRRGPSIHQRFGAVYVFDKVGGTWQSTQLLESSQTQTVSDAFGEAMAADGLNLAIKVGTDMEFHRLDPVTRQYTLEDRVAYPNTSVGQRFRAVALQDDLFAYHLDDPGPGSGSFEFLRRQPSTGLWLPAGSKSGSGAQLTLAGNRLLSSSGLQSNSNAVTVYINTNGTWLYETTLRISDFVIQGAFERLGKDVSASGNFVLLGGGSSGTLGGDRAYLWNFDCDTIVSTAICGQTAPNSSGSPGFLLGFGTRRIAQDGLTLLSTQLPANSFGIYLASRVSSLTHSPGNSQGDLCLGGNLGRFSSASEIYYSGMDGQASLAVDVRNLPTLHGRTSAMAGEEWYFQGWYRDHNPYATSNFTNSIQIVFQ